MIGYVKHKVKQRHSYETEVIRMNRRNEDIFRLALTGLMTALVLTSTIMFRIPMPFTNGYIHLGDTMIYLAVLTLGKKRGALAGGLGSSLADLLGGYTHYVPWTFAIKALMAVVMGIALERAEKQIASGSGRRFCPSEILAMIAAGLTMTAGYYIAASIMRGNWMTPLLSVPGNILQFAAGTALAYMISGALLKTPVRRYFAIRL